MKRIVVMLTVAALRALMLVVSAMPAFAVSGSQASCQGIAAQADTLLGGPGARAVTVPGVFAEKKPHGFLFSDFSKFHSGTREECLA